jgi:subtilase family serine protease
MHASHERVPIRQRRSLLRAVAVLPALAALALIMSTIATPGPALAAGPQRLGVPGSHPAWATSAADTGPVAAGTVIDARVYLAGRDPAGLAAYAQQVSEPGNPEYAHYLTPAQYQQRFGPTAAQVTGVRQWLTGAGLDVTAVTSHYVAVQGTESATAAAFGTRLHTYRVAGASQRAPQGPVSIPAAVAPAVLTVAGLSTSSVQLSPDTTGPISLAGPAAKASSANGATCSAYWGQVAAPVPPAYGHALDYDLCGYVPAQLRAAYGVNQTGLTGKGTTIAIVNLGASPTIVSDVNTYARQNGGQPLRPGQLTQYLPSDIAQSCPSTSRQTGGYYAEETLDVEAAHGMAPDANIAYVGADCSSTPVPPLQALVDAETRIVDGHLADIVSNSWHLGLEAQMPPGIVDAFQQVFEQGAVEGIGFYYSSGDNGDWSSATPGNQPAVQYPGSDPWVTSVGGTSLATGPHGGYKWETGWGSDLAPLAADGTSWVGLPGSFAGGSGGGPSSLFPQPFYQRGVVPAALSEPAGAAGPMRVMPDIAADADPATGMLVGLSMGPPGQTPQYTEVSFGGTSVATPVIAGIQADAQQARHGVPIGFANPAIYARSRAGVYHDVTDHPLGPNVTIAAVDASFGPSGINYTAVTFALDSSLYATVGYDDVTGVGTPTARYLNSYRWP